MRVVDFIVCDDIRTEVGNKLSLMGLYADSIRIQGDAPPPFNIALSVFVRVEVSSEDVLPDTYSLAVTLNHEQLGVAASNVAIPADRRLIQFVVHFKPLPVPALGELRFIAQFLRADNRIGAPHEYTLMIERDGG